MDPRFRTVALVAAALGLLVSLFFALRPSDGEETAPATTTVATTTVATTTVATTTATTEQATTTAPEEPPPPPTTTGSQGPGTIHINYTVAGGRPVGGIARDSISRG